MTQFAWTGDRIAAVAGSVALLALLYVFFFGKRRPAAAAAAGEGGQEVTIVVEGGYAPDLILARRGLPLRLVFDRRESSPCSDEIVLPDFGVRRPLPAHARTTIEIVPDRTGDFEFTCGMNMLHGKIRVVEG
jgi:Cu+-exporting ATPase